MRLAQHGQIMAEELIARWYADPDLRQSPDATNPIAFLRSLFGSDMTLPLMAFSATADADDRTDAKTIDAGRVAVGFLMELAAIVDDITRRETDRIFGGLATHSYDAASLADCEVIARETAERAAQWLARTKGGRDGSV